MKVIGLLNKRKEVRRICEVNETNAERLVSNKQAVYINDDSSINKAKNFLDMRMLGSGSGKRSKYKESE